MRDFSCGKFCIINNYSYLYIVSSHQASQRCSNAWGFFVIFHKPFLVLGNVKRGQSRFLSLFDSLNLHGKILTDISMYSTQYINRLDDYGPLNKMRELSLDILKLL